jgi:tetratricopeptide (TPR) repeat protein
VTKILPAFILFFGLILAGNYLAAQDEKAFLNAVSAARDMLRQNADSAATLAKKAVLHASNDAERAEAHELSGDALRHAGRLEAAGAEYALLLDQARKTADAQLLGRALNGKGAIERAFENYGRSVAHHSEALRVFDSLGNALGVAQSMHELAVTLVGMGEQTQAMEMHSRALRIREEEQFRPAIAESHSSIAALYIQAGKLDSALLHYREALSLRRQLGVLSIEVATTLHDIGYVYRLQGDATRALDYYRESLGLSRRLGDRKQIAATQKDIGAAYIRLRDYARARESLDAASRLAESLGLARAHAEVLREQASLEEAMGNSAAALRLLRRHQAVTDSLDQLLRSARLRHAVGEDEGVRELLDTESSGSIGSDFMVFLVVVIGLLVIIVVIALSTLRMRGRVNLALSGKNREIETMIVELQRLNHDIVRSEEKYRLLFERLPVGVFLYNAEMTMHPGQRRLRGHHRFAAGETRGT